MNPRILLNSRAAVGLALVAAALGTLPALAASQTPPAAPSGWATIRGTVVDSVHGGPLVKAMVVVDGAGRIGVTDIFGQYSIDSIPAGSYRLLLMHPVLDTIGLTITTRVTPVRPNEIITMEIAIPSANRILLMRCSPAMLATRGPGALIGQVIDPDSQQPAVGSKVQLLYVDPGVLGFKGQSVVREAVVDSTGGYRICGLPEGMTGKLQVFRNGVSSGQVEVKLDKGPLGLRSLSITSARVATQGADSAGRARPVYFGSARLSGKVVSSSGRPIESARVAIEGTGRATLTNARGEFLLDSLPAGTQSVEVRKIGFGATDKPVELGGNASSSVTVVMGTYELPAVQVTASVDRALTVLGYEDRKKSGFGYFLDGDKIRKNATRFSDLVRDAPMLRVYPTGTGRNIIKSARDPAAGCVNFIVDDARWVEMEPGDLDNFVQPTEIQAVEVYNPSSAPPRFESPGSSKCATVVIWTLRGTNRVRKK